VPTTRRPEKRNATSAQAANRAVEAGKAVEHALAAGDGRPRFGIAGQFGEFLDIGAGNEARRLGRTDDQALGRIAFQLGQNGVEFQQDRFGQDIDAGVLHVERELVDAVAAPLGLPMCQSRHAVTPYAVSSSMAPPCPPPMQSDAMPRFMPRLRRAWIR